MGSNLPKHVRCFFAYTQRLPQGAFSTLSDDGRDELEKVVMKPIEEAMAERPTARISTIVSIVAAQVQDEVDEIMIRDEDQQHIDRIVDAALAKFPSTYDLRNADEDTLDRVASVVREHMEEVARDWNLDACTSQRLVLDDLIEEATCRASFQIEAILDGEELDDGDEEQDCDA